MDEIEIVISTREKDFGGFSVRRVLPYASHRMVGHHPAKSFAEFQQDDAKVKVLLGSIFERQSPVAVDSDMFYAEVYLDGSLRLSADGRERAVYVVDGSVDIGEHIPLPL